MGLERVDATLEIAQRGIRLDPLWSTQHFFLGLAHLNMGNASAAIDPIHKAISLLRETGAGESMMSWFCWSLAVAYQAVDRHHDALEMMQQAFPRLRDAIKARRKPYVYLKSFDLIARSRRELVQQLDERMTSAAGTSGYATTCRQLSSSRR